MSVSKGRSLTPAEAKEAGEAMREYSIGQMVAGLRRDPQMLPAMKELIAAMEADGFAGADDNLAEAVRRYEDEASA